VALEHGDDRQVRTELAQLEEVGDGAPLMLGDGEAGLGAHVRLAHPVLRGDPAEPAKFLLVAACRGDVGGGAVSEGAVKVDLLVAAGVEEPVWSRLREGRPSVAEAAVADHERAETHLGPQPVRRVGAEPESHRRRLASCLFEPSGELGDSGHVEGLSGLDARKMRAAAGKGGGGGEAGHAASRSRASRVLWRSGRAGVAVPCPASPTFPAVGVSGSGRGCER
jgi:hypothetical protein